MKALIVCDFNLTRFDDVKLMCDYARSRYGLATLLIRSKPGQRECSIADHVLDLDPLAPGFAQAAAERIRELGIQPLALLPFSDNAVKTGAELAELLGLPHDSATLAQAAFSKRSYREAEARVSELLEAQGVFVPKSATVRSLEELWSFARSCSGGFVLKPSCEGNNRGVIRLGPGDDLEQAFDEVKQYLADGLICEEYIDLPGEFSFDGIGHLSFVTEKLSRTDRYPVEFGQIVPAELPSPKLEAIKRAGRAANLIVGQKIGPFHNEIKFDPDSQMSAVIEPNRRPAGMRIWHLAEKVYGMSFFHLWVDQLVAGLLPASLPEPRGRAAIRMLGAPGDGIFKMSVLDQASKEEVESWILSRIQSEMPDDVEWFEFRLNVGSGSPVSAVQKDNSGFIAQICAYAPSEAIDLHGALDRVEAIWHEMARQWIREESEVAV